MKYDIIIIDSGKSESQKQKGEIVMGIYLNPDNVFSGSTKFGNLYR